MKPLSPKGELRAGVLLYKIEKFFSMVDNDVTSFSAMIELLLRRTLQPLDCNSSFQKHSNECNKTPL